MFFVYSRLFLALQGNDTRLFLHRLITQDVANMEEGTLRYGALLDSKGRYETDMMLWGTSKGIFVGVSPALRMAAKNIMLRYCLRQQVSIVESDDLYVVVWDVDPEIAENICTKVKSLGGYMQYDPRSDVLGHVLFIPALQKEAFYALMSAYAITQANKAEYYYHQWRQGILEGDALIPGKSIILEYNFDLLGGISWNKGCFLGQELMARTHNLGQIRKRVLPLKILDKPCLYAKQGDILFATEKEHRKNFGKLVHIQSPYAFAFLYLEELKGKTEYHAYTSQGDALYGVVPVWMRGGLNEHCT